MKASNGMSHKNLNKFVYQNKLTFLVDKDGDERSHQTQYDLDTNDRTHSNNNW